jgi:hypothetical protein
MLIYNYEFGTESVDWKLMEYKAMDFIGTESLKFFGNNTFLRINDKTDIDIKHGTYYDAAINIPNAKSLKINGTSMHVSTINDDGVVDTAALISIETKNYRLVKYSTGFEEDSVDCQIMKQVTTQNHRIMLVLFSDISKLTLILFNNTLKRYEYWTLTHDGSGKLELKNLTGTCDEIRSALKEFAGFDKGNKFKSCKISLYFTFPMAYYIITTMNNDSVYDIVDSKNYKVIHIDDEYAKNHSTKDILTKANEISAIPNGSICVSLYGIEPNDIHRYRDDRIKYIFKLYENGTTTDF